MNEENPTIQRLENQISWYDHKSNTSQHLFQRLKILEIIVAAFIPFLSGINAMRWLQNSFCCKIRV